MSLDSSANRHGNCKLRRDESSTRHRCRDRERTFAAVVEDVQATILHSQRSQRSQYFLGLLGLVSGQSVRSHGAVFPTRRSAIDASILPILIAFRVNVVLETWRLVYSLAGDVLLKPILANAGKDISHWFSAETRDVSYIVVRIMRLVTATFPSNCFPQVKTHIHPVTGCVAPYCPNGRFVHVPPPFPRSDWNNNFGTPWWQDSKYFIGILSCRTRRIRVINTLTLEEQVVEVSKTRLCNSI